MIRKITAAVILILSAAIISACSPRDMAIGITGSLSDKPVLQESFPSSSPVSATASPLQPSPSPASADEVPATSPAQFCTEQPSACETPCPKENVDPNAALFTDDTSNEGTAWNFLMSQFYNPYAVAGILGNLEQESRCNPEIVPWDFTGRSYGICQWTDDRKSELYRFATDCGKDVNSLDLQLSFIIMELSEKYPELFIHLFNSADAADAAREFCFKYEQASAVNNCVSFAEDFLERYYGTGG